MGASSREFLDFRMSMDEYEQIPSEYRSSMEVKVVRVEGEDFSFDEHWKDLKSKSDKAYKDLKKREYDLRHNFKNI